MTDDTGWTRIDTEAAFRRAVVDRALTAEGLRFTLHADGRISGVAGGGHLAGTWSWRDEHFCRTAALDGEDLGEDHEVIEIRADQMRYTRDGGRGAASVVAIGPPG